jgi:GLPGLI family protein
MSVIKYFLFSFVIVCAAATADAQYTFYGKIEYEKKTNVHAQMKQWGDDNNSWYERMKSQVAQFNVTYFDMLFDTSRAIYKPGREVENKSLFWGSPAAENIVLTDFHANRVNAVKAVYEQKFQVQDSIRKMEWRVKDEVRTIANFKCYKAVGRICDSVYVVAFYTEDIPVSGGPEMFAGLPGMIMELAIPRLHTTWVATRVETVHAQEKDFELPKKGKKVTGKELYETVQSSLKDWGKWATTNVWWTTL